MQYVWECREDEPLIWWEYFLHYCALGPARSVALARTTVAALQRLEQRTTRPSGAPQEADDAPEAGAGPEGAPLYTLTQWRRMARRFQWQARARAWDGWFAQRVRTPTQLLGTLDQRSHDLLVRRLLSSALHIFDAANLEALDDAQARRLLPVAQGMVRSALQAQREMIRYGRVGAALADPDEAADDAGAPGAWQARMRTTAQQMERLLAAGLLPSGKPGEATASALLAMVEALPPEPAQEAAAPPPTVAETQLLVVTGDDRQLEIDVAMIRAVARTTGLRYEQIAHATRDDLETHLRRARSLGRPIPWVHIACHVSHEGVRFADGVADGAWLSSVLMGVEVLLIAGCKGDRVGDWLAVVPYVLTLSDAIAHADAATLTRYFWEAMARGEPPTAALAQAMDRCPQVLWESVVAHW